MSDLAFQKKTRFTGETGLLLFAVVPPGIVLNSQVAVYHHFSETTQE